MKIGIWLGFDVKESAGGAFSYTDRLIQLVDKYRFSDDIDICFVNLIGCGSFNKEICSLVNLPASILYLIQKYPFLYRLVKAVSRRIVAIKGYGKVLSSRGIKIMYYLHQGECLDSNFPFIATNWDIGHRSTQAFPELMWSGKTYETRENYYRNILPKALMVFSESQTGKKELMEYANIGSHKIRVLPLFGGGVTQQILSEERGKAILSKYGLEAGKFYFYPAQFWAHKNHRNLVLAFREVHERFPDLKLVLSGSDKGNKDYIEKIIKDNHLIEDVIFLGFVPIEELYCMYKFATALVMASHFGPTNMPPIEAMEIGCPVVCSDLGGHREILSNSAVYFDSYNVFSMVEAMITVFEHNEKYRLLIANQKKVSDFSEEKAIERLEKLLKEVVEIRGCWG